jgi:hypothetical protein
MNPWLRYVLAGLAAGFAMLAASMATFGPAQAILTDPALQSDKFLDAFFGDPPPRAASIPFLFPLGFIGLGFVHALAFHILYRGLSRNWVVAGATFGFAAWLIAYPWFEFYLPWNVMLEPAPLVLLELACWLAVTLAGSLALAFVYRGRLVDHHLSLYRP